MAETPSPNRGPQSKPTEPWRIERMVQRVPGHLGEESRHSPWLVVVAVAVVVIVGALLLFFSNFSAGGILPPPTTLTPKPRTTVIRVTATPENTATPTLPPTVSTTRYTVKKGDTLSTVARDFKTSVQAIRDANKLTDDTIRVGDILIIPVPPPAPTPGAVADGTPPTTEATSTPLVFQTPTLIAFLQTSTPATPTTPTPTPGVVPYIVRQGDTLSAIAAVFSTTVQSIIDLNKLDGPSIRAGQTLTVPIGAWTPTPTATVHSEPTVTLTPQFAYPAPALLYPKDGAAIAHGTSVVLSWASAGSLRDDEYYVVHLAYESNGEQVNLPSHEVHEGNSLTLDTSPVGGPGPQQFWWYVLVVRVSGCGPAAPAAVQPCAVSPVSETRSFSWR
jgi:LysM repeat protein